MFLNFVSLLVAVRFVTLEFVALAETADSDEEIQYCLAYSCDTSN